MERMVGIHPSNLSTLKFNDLAGSNPTPLDFIKLEHFFHACRAAASEKEFRLSTSHLRHSTDESLQRISAILERALLKRMPTEIRIESDGYGGFNLPITGEGFGRTLCTYQEEMTLIYEKLVSEQKSYLMHPSRRSDLIDYLGTTFNDVERAADRLITYRCCGYYPLKISELKNELEMFNRERSQLEQKLDHCEPRVIHDFTSLTENDFLFIRDHLCRKYVLLAFQTLASKSKLDILDLSEKELYNYESNENSVAHPELSSLAQAYYEEFRPNFHFGVVVTYLKHLRNSDLNTLEEFCLNKRLNEIKGLISYTEDAIERSNAAFISQQELISKKPQDFHPGDFTFMTDPLTVRVLTNAYNAVEKLQVWSFFDTPPPNNSYQLWGHPIIYKIGKMLSSDGHSGFSMGYTMRSMQRIRKLGWEAFVRDSLESDAAQLGVLTKISQA